MTIKSVFLFLLIAAPYLTYGIAQTSRLHDAVQTGNLDKIKSALKPWKSPNGHNENRSTPLQIAIMADRADVVEFLVSKGAQVYLADAADSKVDHVLYAVQLQKRDIAEILLKAGGPPPNSDALFEAIRRVDPAFVALLLKYRSPIKSSSDSSTTAIKAVVSIPQTTPIERRIAVAEVLLAHGAALSTYEEGDAKYNALLHHLFWQSKPDLEMAGYLLDRGVPINALNRDGHTALRVAVIIKSVEGVRFLLDRKASPNVGVPIAAVFKTYGEPDALQISILELLIKHGANVNRGDHTGNLPIINAAKAKSYVGVKLLLDAGAKPDIGLGTKWISEIATTEDIRALLLKAAAAAEAKENSARQQAKAQVQANKFTDEQARIMKCAQAHLAKEGIRPGTPINCPRIGVIGGVGGNSAQFDYKTRPAPYLDPRASSQAN